MVENGIVATVGGSIEELKVNALEAYNLLMEELGQEEVAIEAIHFFLVPALFLEESPAFQFAL